MRELILNSNADLLHTDTKRLLERDYRLWYWRRSRWKIVGDTSENIEKKESNSAFKFSFLAGGAALATGLIGNQIHRKKWPMVVYAKVITDLEYNPVNKLNIQKEILAKIADHECIVLKGALEATEGPLVVYARVEPADAWAIIKRICWQE